MFETTEPTKLPEITSIQKRLEAFTELFFDLYPNLISYRSKLFIAGGAIRSMILEEEVKDIDIFCKDQVTADAIKEMKLGYTTDNAVNLFMYPLKVQIVTTEVGSLQEIINQFDFTMNMNYYDFETGSIEVIHLPDILSRTLKVNKNCRNKLGTLARIVKFVNRGYKLHSKENLLELGCQLTRMNSISTFTELEEESRLYFSDDEYRNIDYVEKDVESVNRFTFRSTKKGSGL